MKNKDIFDNSNDFDDDLEELNNSNFNDNDEEKFTTEPIENEKKKKENVSQKNYTLLYLIIICITVISSVGIFSYFNYQKEQLKQEQENERIEKEQKNKETRQNQLNNCISRAKTNRTDLWNSNCTKQSDGSCKIRTDSGQIEWIEQRYQQDLNNCYQLYGN